MNNITPVILCGESGTRLWPLSRAGFPKQFLVRTNNVSDKDPQFAAQLANAYVEELGKLLNRLAVTEAQQRRMFFEKQLTNAKDGLIKAEQALKSSGVKSSALKASMRGYLTESAPDFKQAQTEMSALRDQLARAEKEEPSSNGDSDYIAKSRAFKYHETLFELFAKQFEMARIDESREGAVIQVVDAAERKIKPKKALIAMMTTLAVGFALLLFVFIRQALRGAAQTPESAEKLARLHGAWARALGRA